MPVRKDKTTIIVSILSLIVLAFVTYVTVYEQIISQNNGFFNAIIFGVVLVLLFIFITLIARIVGLRPEAETSVFVNYLGYIFLLAIFIFFIFLKLRYTSNVPIAESFPYKAADYIVNGNLYEGNEVSNSLINFPSNFNYALSLSVIFKVFCSSSNPALVSEAQAHSYLVSNIVLLAITAAGVFACTFVLSNKACAFVASIITLFMPCSSLLVYSYNTELFVAMNFIVSLYVYLLLILRWHKSYKTIVALSIILGIFTGFTVCSEPALIFVYIVLLIWLIKQNKQPKSSMIITGVSSVLTFSLLTVVKTLLMKASFLDVIKGYLNAFNPVLNRKLSETMSFSDCYHAFVTRLNSPSRFWSGIYYFLSDSTGNTYTDNQALWLKIADQLIYIFMILMCVMLIVFLLRAIYCKVLPGISVFIAAFFAQILGGGNDVCYFYFIVLIIILGCSTIYYMYLNHHQDYAVMLLNADTKRDMEIKAIRNGEEIKEDEYPEEQAAKEEPVDLVRARALVYIGENEELYQQIKEEERLNRINNPVAATKIKSEISEVTGEYESKEEKIEFFDNLDEKTEIKTVSDVKPIPATRPVEVVKPQLAESYDYDEPEPEIDLNSMPDALKYSLPSDNQKDNQQENVNNDLNNLRFKSNIDGNVIEESKEADVAAPETPLTQDTSSDNTADADIGGFVFRKREEAPSAASLPDDNTGKDKGRHKDKVKPEKVKKVKPEKVKKEKPDKKSKLKPGEPIENPLPLPKPHVSKDLDFDYEVSDNDDFDWD